MVIQTKVNNIKNVDLKKLLGGKFIYVGYPENSSRTGSNLTNAQIAFLNTEGTRPRKVSSDIQKRMDSGTSYSDAFIAYIRANGEPRWHIPPRPFLDTAINNNQEKINDHIKNIAIKAIEKENVEDELDRLGMRAVNYVKKFIRNYPDNRLTPNAESTIKKKGEDHPLKGLTGQLLNGVTYVKGD